jgi:hypothetical protein
VVVDVDNRVAPELSVDESSRCAVEALDTEVGCPPRPKPTLDGIDPGPSSLDRPQLDPTLGTKGTLIDGVYRATFGRITSMRGASATGAMGVNTWACGRRRGFLGAGRRSVGGAQGIAYGGIEVVAIHIHMTSASVHIVFLHTGASERRLSWGSP